MKPTEKKRRAYAKLKERYGDQAYFHTPEWQAKEREADRAIARGEVSGPFSSAEEAIAHLRRSTRRRGRS